MEKTYFCELTMLCGAVGR